MEPERARALLQDELDRLDADVTTERPAPGADRSAEGMDFGDAGARATGSMDHDLALGTRDNRRRQVRAALERLDRGEYGRCTVCGAGIDDERLEIRPETDRCREHPDGGRGLPGPVEG